MPQPPGCDRALYSSEPELAPCDAIVGAAAQVRGLTCRIEYHQVDRALAYADAALWVAKVLPHRRDIGTAARRIEQTVHRDAARVAWHRLVRCGTSHVPSAEADARHPARRLFAFDSVRRAFDVEQPARG